jgi:hypothetical protein
VGHAPLLRWLQRPADASVLTCVSVCVGGGVGYGSSAGSKALLFVNVSPDAADLSESVSSATFAARARSVELGAARREASRERRDVPASPGASVQQLSPAASKLGAARREASRERRDVPASPGASVQQLSPAASKLRRPQSAQTPSPHRPEFVTK